MRIIYFECIYWRTWSIWVERLPSFGIRSGWPKQPNCTVRYAKYSCKNEFPRVLFHLKSHPKRTNCEQNNILVWYYFVRLFEVFSYYLFSLFFHVVHLNENYIFHAICWGHFLVAHFFLSTISMFASRIYLVWLQKLKWMHVEHEMWFEKKIMSWHRCKSSHIWREFHCVAKRSVVMAR